MEDRHASDHTLKLTQNLEVDVFPLTVLVVDRYQSDIGGMRWTGRMASDNWHDTGLHTEQRDVLSIATIRQHFLCLIVTHVCAYAPICLATTHWDDRPTPTTTHGRVLLAHVVNEALWNAPVQNKSPSARGLSLHSASQSQRIGFIQSTAEPNAFYITRLTYSTEYR